MERLTKRLPDGKAVMDCDSCEQKKDKQCTFYECRASLIKRLAAYEDTGLTPEEIKDSCTPTTVIIMAGQALGVHPCRLRELAEADKDGRIRIIPESQNGACGGCWYFEREPGTKHGTCAKRPHPRDRYGKIDRSKQFIVSQSTQSCRLYMTRRSEAERAMEGKKDG